MSTDEIAFITGANKGIGFEVARQLGKQGIHVLVGARDAERGAAAVEQLQAEGITATYIPIDVTDDASVQAAAQTISEQFGKLDILVNNAGISPREAFVPLSALDLNLMRKAYDTNVFGVVAVTQAMLPLLKQGDSPRVVMVSSMAGSLNTITNPDSFFATVPPFFTYPATKTALNGITVWMARDLAAEGIKVNMVCPGYVATDLNGGQGYRTVEEGARIVVKFATIDADGPSGGFFDDAGTVPW